MIKLNNIKYKLLLCTFVMINIYNLSFSLNNICREFIANNNDKIYQFKDNYIFYNFNKIKFKNKFNFSPIKIKNSILKDSKGGQLLAIPLTDDSKFNSQDEYKNILHVFNTKACLYNSDIIQFSGRDGNLIHLVSIEYEVLSEPHKSYTFKIKNVLESYTGSKKDL